MKPAGRENGDQIVQMPQMLLAERFQLRLRREMVEMPVHRLVVAKGGANAKVPVAVGGTALSGGSVVGGIPGQIWLLFLGMEKRRCGRAGDLRMLRIRWRVRPG
jgi:hypothetical protein